MRGLTPTIIKSLIFVVVTVIATGILLVTISNPGASGGATYKADFSDVTALVTGDDVRIAGVRVGQVTKIGIDKQHDAEVTFTVEDTVKLASTVTASIKYRNLVGQRYLDIEQGAGSPAQPWPAKNIIGVDRTTPALDLTALFNGFQPLFKALDPGEVNQVSYEIIQIFQGQGTTMEDLLTQTASLTSTLADKDAVIGQVIDNLNAVLGTVNSHTNALGNTLDTLQQLVSGLAQDREAIGTAFTGIANLTTSVTGLLQDGRQPLATAINSLGALSGNLAEATPTLQSFLQHFPDKVNTIGRTASYGGWVNAYVCSLIPYEPPTTPGGVRTPVAAHPSVTPTDPAAGTYVGDTGITSTTSRCQS